MLKVDKKCRDGLPVLALSFSAADCCITEMKNKMINTRNWNIVVDIIIAIE